MTNDVIHKQGVSKKTRVDSRMEQLGIKHILRNRDVYQDYTGAINIFFMRFQQTWMAIWYDIAR
jgi:hypothetical protein